MEEEYSGPTTGLLMLNFKHTDPFKEAYQAAGAGSGNQVHLRVRQRNRRQCVLTITGLDGDLDLKEICKALRKRLKCNGTIKKHDELGKIIQLQGDHRRAVRKFLIEMDIVADEQIVVHGA